MDSVAIPACTATCLSMDYELREFFCRPLSRSPPCLCYCGYTRAIQLYGNEANLRNQAISRGFVAWAADNQEAHQRYRRFANDLGYNVDTGFSKPDEGLYFKTCPTDVDPKPQQPGTRETDPRSLCPCPDTPETTQDEPTSISIPCDSEGGFSGPQAIPKALKLMSGARHADPKDSPATCVGAAEIALVLAEMLEFSINPDISEDAAAQCRKSARETLEYLGGKEGLQKFVDVMYQESPQHGSSHSTPKFGSTLRG